jgi:predicted nucleotide-binding protein
VVLELGFFLGKLGRNHVTVLEDPGIEEPSDIRGIVYIPLDRNGAWKAKLGRELAASGIVVDMNQAP